MIISAIKIYFIVYDDILSFIICHCTILPYARLNEITILSTCVCIYIYISHFSHSVSQSCPSPHLGDCKDFAQYLKMFPDFQQHESRSKGRWRNEWFRKDLNTTSLIGEGGLRAKAVAKDRHVPSWDAVSYTYNVFCILLVRTLLQKKTLAHCAR